MPINKISKTGQGSRVSIHVATALHYVQQISQSDVVDVFYLQTFASGYNGMGGQSHFGIHVSSLYLLCLTLRA